VSEKRCARAPTAAQITAFRAHFVAGIEAAAARDAFREIQGARKVLKHLPESPLCSVGLATGAWSDSARCKMRSAGMQYDSFPTASADDAMARVSIMQTAIDRLIARRGAI